MGQRGPATWKFLTSSKLEVRIVSSVARVDAELKIWISGNSVPIRKQFTKQVDIYEAQAILSHFVVS